MVIMHPKNQLSIQEKQRIIDGLIDRYVKSGLLTDETSIVVTEQRIYFENLVVPSPKRNLGIGRKFLQDLVAEGFLVEPTMPKKSSLGFWNTMFQEKLIPFSPLEYTTWEDS